jgi:hypothetical protein
MASEEYNYGTFHKYMMQEDMHFRGGPPAGELAPVFDLPTVDESRFRLEDFRSKQPVLVEFASIT